MLNFDINSCYKFPLSESLNEGNIKMTDFLNDCINNTEHVLKNISIWIPLKIAFSEIELMKEFLKLTLTIRNDRQGPRRHTISVHCKNYKKTHCKFQITITRPILQNYFELYHKNEHQSDCLRSSEIDKRIILSQIARLTKNTNYSVKSKMQILNTKGLNTNQFKNAIYNKHSMITKKADLKDKFSVDDFLLNLIKLNEVKDNIARYHLDDEGKFFYCLLANQKLLQTVYCYDTFAIDGTYKLLFIDMCLIVFGGIDLEHKFTPIVFCICPNEDKSVFDWVFEQIEDLLNFKNLKFFPLNIIGDGSAALDSAVMEKYPDTIKINCFAHVSRTLNQKVKRISKENGKKIYADICFLQRCITPIFFRNAHSAFERLWINFPEYRDFLVYFRNNYIFKNYNWFEGCRPGIPKTNNALEGFNLALKKCHFNWTKQYLLTFVKKLGNILEDRSMEFGEQNGFMKYMISYDSDEFEMLSETEFFENIGSEGTVSYYLYTNERTIDKDDLLILARKCLLNIDNSLNYSDVKKVISTPIVVASPKTGKWEDFCCSCVSFRRKFKCSHIYKLVMDKFKSDALRFNIDIFKRKKKKFKIIPGSSLRRE